LFKSRLTVLERITIHKSEKKQLKISTLWDVGWKIVTGLLADHKVSIFTEKNLI